MKKITFVLFLLVCAVSVSAQLKVNADGEVIAGYEADNGTIYNFGIGKPQYIYTLPSGLPVSGAVYSVGRWTLQIGGGTSSTANFLHIRPGTTLPSPTYYGLYIQSDNIGIGKKPVSGAKLDVNGAIAVNGTIIHSSDERLKTNIQPIIELVPKLYDLQGKSYFKMLPDSTEKFFEYGFIAQELKEQFPDLVVETSDGYLAVNYTALIPVIVEALKDQKQQIEQLNERLTVLENAQNTPHQQNAPARNQQAANQPAALFQNAPNPFNENSEIGFYLPESVKSAMLCVYDMNGKQLSQNIIKERGNSAFIVSAKSYTAGMYLYSLIADNQVIDTKRMILTK